MNTRMMFARAEDKCCQPPSPRLRRSGCGNVAKTNTNSQFASAKATADKLETGNIGIGNSSTMATFYKMFAVLAAAVVTGCVSGPKVDNTPVAALDLNCYLGEWYEIARFDHSFERDVEQAKANYTLNEDGTIKVVNSGIKDGKSKTAIGKGKRTENPALLRVSFFGPFYADYRVMTIDADYTYALVGSGGADYLWILSRTRALSAAAKSKLLAEAKRRGYNTGKLIWVKQE